ncbi:amino acid adenylation domain-containing protein [Syntrophomonas curvata]
MNRKEILMAYKEGKLAEDDVKERLRMIKQQSMKQPLAEGQKGLWILQKSLPDLSSYNLPICFRVNQTLDIEIFKKTCHFILEQFPILSSIFGEDNGVPYQLIKPSKPLFFEHEDISHLESNEIFVYLRKKAQEPFALESGPLMRFHLFSRSQQENIVLIVVHHIVIDGSSMLLLITSLLDAYKDLIDGKELTITPHSTTYNDFVIWEQEMLLSQDAEEHLAYWRKKLSGRLPVLELPADKPRSPSNKSDGQSCTSSLSLELTAGLKDFAQAHQTNLSIVLLGIYKVLLYRYTGLEDIIVGMPAIVRPEERFDDLMGYFINMLPIRSHLAEQQPFNKFIHELQFNVVDGLDHATYPFPVLVRELNVNRERTNHPVFQTAFYFQNFDGFQGLRQIERQYQNTLLIEFIEEIHQEGEYDLTIEVFEQDERFTVNFKYDSNLFDRPSILRMMEHYIKLAEEIAQDPTRPVRDYSFITTGEQTAVLVDWNATQADYPYKCFHELFAIQAQKTPDAVAVNYEGDCLTYRELDDKSSCLAVYLQKLGIGPDCLVGICVERSLEMIVGLLGIMKAGGAYIPLDPDYPQARLEYMIQDSRIGFVLAQSQLMPKMPGMVGSSIQSILLDQDWEAIQQRAGLEVPKQEVKPEHLAYVLYTSGSTGNPKGVMIPHKALTNFLLSMGKQPGINSQDRLLAVTTYCFDIAGLELYLPLICGAQCFICSAEKVKDIEKLKQEIQRVKPTIMQATPVTWIMLFQTGWKNKEKIKILCGGEALPGKLKQNFMDTNSDVWNMFGPTETTIWSTVQHIKENEPITIGKPIDNTRIYILDNNLKPTPIGIAGELHIAGDGLARGYLNKPELTAEKFIDNPFNQGYKLYKTGDLARWLPDGNIEYIGRIDYQIKIRGYRIELGEIESQLGQHPGIKDCVAVMREQEGNKQLVAYYTTKDAWDLTDQQELRRHLKACLPEYMIPSHILRLDNIPLTPNGKVDRNELIKRDIAIAGSPRTSLPESKVEEKVLKIWQGILQVNDIDMEAGFFDVGGDSLLAVAAAARIKKELDCDFSVTDLFKHPNIKAASAYIAELKGENGFPAKEHETPIFPNINRKSPDRFEHVLDSLPEYYQDSLAIIGISCHFPGAKNHFEFWNNLREGKENIRFFTKDELAEFGVSERLIRNPDYIAVQSTIEGKELFDPEFFNISPQAAEIMDPQLRLLLTHSWKAIEDAGYAVKQIPDTSVFMSASNNFYQASLPGSSAQVMEDSDGYVSWLLAQDGTIPTMISHKLGLKGPSYFVHSNCSSSLVGLYSAYQSLKFDEAGYALIGAAAIHSHPSLGYVHQPGLNFSSDGHIKAFDASADGMIGGEGVAVVLVKKAANAIRDRDHIYAILRGIGVNNDGLDKAGFYAPSVKGQADVIQKVLDTTQIDVESISYIETHGTGTKLGDQIEFAALNDIYKQYTSRKQFCGIGSVKTNIGHLDSTAGLAGCIKVALSLYHNVIPPSINFREPNRDFEMGDSPFYVVDKLTELEEKPIPCRAALSSFGIGGTNAHAIFEQYTYPGQLQGYGNSNNCCIIPLSAKNNDRLRVYVQELLKFIKVNGEDNIDLANLAYTFQVGREAMDNRAVFVAENINELTQKLEDYLHGKEPIEGCFRGSIKQSKDFVTWFYDNEETAELINKWISRGKLHKLARMWTSIPHVDWESLYSNTRPCRMSLPTYPFAEEPYWLPAAASSTGAGENSWATASGLNPLLHQNTSDLLEQRFSSTFSGQEFFLADHVVRGKSVLPGVAYLEMARAAVSQSAGRMIDGHTYIRLKNIVWAQPIVADNEPVKVNIVLLPENNRSIAYEIYSEAGINSEPIMHSQGSAELYADSELPILDLADLQTRCKHGVISPVQFYEDARNQGIYHGQAFRSVKKVYVGQGCVLARLFLPASVFDTQDIYVLHPSIMDAAIQAATIFVMNDLDKHELPLPFALEEVEVIEPCSMAVWAYARYSKGSKVGDKVHKIDIDLCNEAGEICVRMKGFSTRVLEGEFKTPASLSAIGTLMLEPVWKEEAIAGKDESRKYIEHIVIFCEVDIENQTGGVQSVVLRSEETRIGERFQLYAVQVLEKIKHLFKKKYKGNVLVQVVVPTQAEKQLFSGLSGLLRTARLENTSFIGQMIETDMAEGSEIINALEENRLCPDDIHIRYQNGRRYVADWNELEVSPGDIDVPWKDGGTYLITGGTGGLGLILAQEIVQKAGNVSLLLVDRSTLTEDKQAALQELRDLGANIEYRETDVTDREAVNHLIRNIIEGYGRLDGIIHAAGLVRDSYIINKTREEVQTVLAPKVAGLINLDQASRELELDFFLIFSSVTGFLGSSGQADYAMANAFMDAFARYRNSMMKSKRRNGQTLSINWPLWKDGGMRVDIETEETMFHNEGMIAMDTETGIQALYKGFASGKNQVVVIRGDLPRVKQKLAGIKAGPDPQKTSFHPTINFDTGSLTGKLENALKLEAAELLKVNKEIDTDTEFIKYGFDSISLTKLTNRLNRKFQIKLLPTVFFEYSSLHSLAEYLAREYESLFAGHFAVQNSVQDTAQPAEQPEEEKPLSFGPKWHSRFTRESWGLPVSKQDAFISEPVAIIGMSGVFPMARDVNEFWRNLEEGRDCITEIPPDRWDWRDYYGDAETEINKTKVKWGGFIDGAGDFDPLFFGISPREAELMDPQQRLLMIHAWKAIEDAGYSGESLSGTRTGIFVGTGSSGYNSLLARADLPIDGLTAINNPPSIGPNRVSYFLNIHGPSEPVETACSSSLVALHRGVAAIQDGSCDMALVGGVNAIVSPEVYISFDKAKALSKDGRCRAFSDKADGFALGEGAGMLFLKKLRTAEETGDHIWGVIRSTAVNHGGRASSLTAPNPKAQVELLKTAYTKAGIDPRTVSFIEAHGTGTELGDPIEVKALISAFKELYEAAGDSEVKNACCGMSSVKTNIGHLALAAGVAGIVKILLQLKHKTLVKSLHCDKINPYIQMEDSPFYIVRETEEWKALQDSRGNDLPRRAGISSFGIGGVNAHVVIEEYIPKAERHLIGISARNPAVIVLSAKNEDRLKEQVRLLLNAIKEERYSETDLADIAYTLQVGREAMEERLGLIVESMTEFTGKLQGYLHRQDGIEYLYRGHVKRNKNTLADKEMQENLNRWIERREYTKLLDLWVKGLKFDWNKLYGKIKPRRISLPTYPFAQERYWVPGIEASNDRGTNIGTMLLGPGWKEEKLIRPKAVPEYARHLVLLCEPDNISPEVIESQLSGVQCIVMQSRQQSIAERFQNYALQAFEETRKILRDKPKNKVLMQIIVTAENERQLFSGLSGLLKSAQLENPKLFGQLIEIEPGEDTQGIIEKLKENSCSPVDSHIRYKDGKRYLHSWNEIEINNEATQIPWKDRGVYLITGGAGELGMIFAREIARKAKAATLILTGRSWLNENQQARLKELEEMGARVEYRQSDVSQKQDTDELLQTVREKYGRLNGIIHGAGVIRDNFIIKKTKEEFLEVMAPKVAGLINIDQASKDLSLDCFILFSSGAGAVGNAGQADYAAANAFMDNYAGFRNTLVAAGQRCGQTLSINWPLWKEGGMHVDKETEEMILQNTGLVAMQTSTGIQALYQSLPSGNDQIMVMEGVLEQMKQAMFLRKVTKSPISDFDIGIANTRLLNELKPALKQTVSGLLNVRAEDIDDDTNFIEYGLDQILFSELAGILNREYDLGLTGIIFGKYPTLEGLANYLVENYEGLFANRFLRSKEPTTEIFISIDEPQLLLEKTTNKMKWLLGKTIKLSNDRIDTDEPLESYGIDSMMITKLNQELKLVFGELSKTLFYEYQTLGALAGYLAANYPQECMKWAGLTESTMQAISSPVDHTGGYQGLNLLRKGKQSHEITSLNPGNAIREPIAVIGISGRYPQATDLNQFWRNLETGQDCISEIPEDRWSLEGFFHPQPQEAVEQCKSYSKWGGFLTGFADFDPLFFNIAPREAINMDPQERLFMESCWEVLEDAGYTREQIASQYRGRVGVYAGITKTGYDLYAPELWENGEQIYPMTSFSSVANRISYYMNFHGPSIPIDTMCSSSLTAIHEACEHLNHGECEMAIAGGVNLYLHPSGYVGLCAKQMLSTEGKCKSFGKGGNGFVPGEGVGAVLLKRLSQAIEDQDHIYAVIRGTSINHGGKTNGFTVPNPIAQEELIRSALDRAGVNARMISYIEAHGTGTELGDPIEITGLNQAFHKDTKDTGFCAIGSVKSNIGHLEAAAGIAGITKIILQMKHKKIAASLYSEELNPNINFSNSPFVVQQELSEWKRPVIGINGEAREYPRIAGISSFGAGGSNAHIVIEEYMSRNEPEQFNINAQNPAVIVLSARNEEQLKEKVKQLLDVIQEEQYSKSDLADIAYTLQVGREAMEERLGVIVGSITELTERLYGYLEGQESIEDMYRGQVKHNKNTMAIFTTDEEMQEALNKWIERRKYTKLLEFWVKGLKFDWNKLYGKIKPRRISLPAYPFARERYWVPDIEKKSAVNAAGSGMASLIHPLLHQNTSDFTEQRFTSTFSGQEFFLADHVVQGRKILPGVACLEMARAAVEQAAGSIMEDQAMIQLKNVVWTQPIVAGEQPVSIHIGLYPENNGEIVYEIYGGFDEKKVYSQGRATLGKIREEINMDLTSLRSNYRSILSSVQCYEIFRFMGVSYGPAHRGIEALYAGTDSVLAKLVLPSVVAGTREQFVLHPSIIDAALQAAIGIYMGDTISGPGQIGPALPFALQELEIISKCTSVMWAWVKYSEGSKAGDKIQKLDINICDEAGKICVRMKGVSLRALEQKGSLAGTNIGTMLLGPGWKEEKLIRPKAVPEYARHLVLLCEPDNISPEVIESQLSGVQCIVMQSRQQSIAERFQNYALQAFEETRKILRDKPKNKVLMQIIVTAENERQLFSGLSGLLKSAQLENPKLFGQLIEIEPGEDTQGIIEKLKENSCSPVDSHIRYKDGKRYLHSWNEIEINNEATQIPWKDRGVYLITGGAGELGMIFAREIARKAKAATLILTGRSWLNENQQARLKELEEMGARVEYRQSDVSQKQDTDELLQTVREKYGRLNGIIHGAGVIRDNFIIKKTKEEFLEVMAPKVAGLINIDQASKDLSLDCFILFSSGAGAVGNAGQADYAAANAFMDNYAGFRNTLVAAGQRCGQTLSINWPLWKEGGMHVDKETEEMILQNTGLVAMQTSTGIQALYQSLPSGNDQIMVMEGEIKRLKVSALEQTAETQFSSSAGSDNGVPGIEPGTLEEKTANYLKRLLSSVIKLPAHRIEADAPMEVYGIDSIMAMKMTKQLEKTFGSLPKTLFFEYQNIQALTGYFIEFYSDQLIGILGLGDRTAAENTKAYIGLQQPREISLNSRGRSRLASIGIEPREEKNKEALDIAIIGIAGRYPQAGNIKEFWKNLRDGIDCITEIPQDRWDHSLYFDEDKDKPGKTYSKWGGFIEGVDEFDPLFFNISPREAEIMDPQERLFLQCVYETLEDAGYTRENLSRHKDRGLAGNVGVYVGVMYEEYQLYGVQEQMQGRPIALSGNPSSIANRVSYFCNFHGPSMALDTMCSSSLTAIHLACQSLQRSECELAIAGGVNVSIHPNKYLGLGQGKFVSSKGRCESFGQGGDGYVPGEGVGAVLLKPLFKAAADGDHIYGIIRATAINHGGKTNGYSVPNPNAQAGVIGRAIKAAGIDPRSLSYIEAHGTGTSLGDPIEIAGLTKTFREYTQDKQFCAIGSAKSNIGHCESAAGIAGLTKVILQLKYHQLVPSLHSEVLNPNIDFSITPFIVQQELGEWKRPVINGREMPRAAGISSFGAGGSNAHVVIEEYIPRDPERATIAITPQNPAIIVLSAKNKERLQEQAERLLAAIEEEQFSESNLADIAYTLQVGREAMEERMGVIVGSIPELIEKLEAFATGQDRNDELYMGEVKRNKDTLSVLAADEEMQETIAKWFERGKYAKLLNLWVKGLNFDWNKLYGEVKPRRISLPTYPFARERYWIPETDSPSASRKASQVISAVLHPLLHQNTSNLSEQRFSSTFTGQEFFLKDHIVQGQNMLPGVAYLEMARAAIEQATDGLIEEPGRIKLKNVIWARPITVKDRPVQVHIGIYPEESGEIAYEIYTRPESKEEEPVIYSQGNAILQPVTEAPSLDLAVLQAQCSQKRLSPGQCYDKYEEMGIIYGPGHRGIEEVYIGADQALARLSLPFSVLNTQNQYVLHPSLMDAALQSSIGLMIGSGDADDSLEASVPFALQEMEVLGPCTSKMWALLRYSDGRKTSAKGLKMDIDICDENGTVCVRMRGFSSRDLESAEEDSVVSGGNIGTLLLRPDWQEYPVTVEGVFEYTDHLVIISELSKISRRNLEKQMKGVRCLTLVSGQDNIEGRFNDYVIQTFEEIQTILKNKAGGKVLVQVVVSGEEEQQMLTGLTGLLKTAQSENPKLIGQVIEIEAGESLEGIIAKLKENSQSPSDNQIRYQDGKRYILGWNEIEDVRENEEIPWKDRGVYLITGGAGGLGMIFAGDIAGKVKDATLILTGRSKLNQDKEAQINEIEALGARVEYRRVDISDQKAVIDLMKHIRERFGTLDGILHSAGVIRDNYIIKKTKEEIEEVLASKVNGLVNLDQASRDMDLDFFILFSSVAGALGNLGQADYAAANAFMDAYAGYRNNLAALQQRQGKTLSVNWPLWKESGMKVDAETEEMLMQTMGLVAMQTSSGIRALYRALSLSKAQAMVMEGDIEKIRDYMGLNFKQILNYPNVNSQKPEDALYKNIFTKILNDELSEQQFERLISSM